MRKIVAGHGYAGIQRQLMRGRWMIAASLRDDSEFRAGECADMESNINPEAVDSLEEFEPGLGARPGQNWALIAHDIVYRADITA